jgi:hypothetical protein
MEQYNLLEAEGTSRDREYSLVDSTAASPIKKVETAPRTQRLVVTKVFGLLNH